MKRLRERMQSDTAASNTVENIIIIALAVFENCFNFLPNYHEAAQNGASKEIVNEIAKKSSQIGLAILVTSYIFLIGSGKLFAKIWGHKIKG